MNSGEFFAHKSKAEAVLQDRVDVAFLDGYHHIEIVLRDFVNAERYMKTDGVIVLHDCLPLNNRMAERRWRLGDPSEPEELRYYWTGDVWKMIPILRAYRPDLGITYLNSAPTGLVVISRVDSANEVLRRNYSAILREFAQQSLDEFGLMQLWSAYPMFEAAEAVSEEAVYRSLFSGRRVKEMM